jgi:tetratricopeptide (TPR) repeat protein
MKTRVQSDRLPSDRDLSRWIKRVALILVVGTIAFTAFYVIDRWRAPSTPIIDQHLALLEEAVRTNPSDVAARGQLADLYVAKHRYQDAITQYDAILETGKAQELAYMGRARAYMGLEQWNLAAPDWQKVVDIAKSGEMANLDPTLEAAFYNLGLIALKQGRPADAAAQLESALKIKKSDADALFLIGQAYTATGQLDLAEKALRQAVAYVPVGWPEPYTALAEMFVKGGRAPMAEWARAMADVASGTNLDTVEARLKVLVNTEAAVDASIALGLYFETRGDLANANQWYNAALAKDPNNAAARLGTGRTAPIQGASKAPASQAPAASLGVKP